MDKPIDFDALFEEKLTEYMKRNVGKYTEQQWESIIPKLYQQYGDTYIKRIDNTPKGYFSAMTSEELISCFQACLETDVPISDFLRNELEVRNCQKELIALVNAGKGEALDLLFSLSEANEQVLDACFALLRSECDEAIEEKILEYLKANADWAKDGAIGLYRNGIKKEGMMEVLSCCKERDDRVFDLLLNELRTSPDEVPMCAALVARYGDERALPVLLDYIRRDDINYLEYRELKYAIEALGREYESERDFSEDVTFQEISRQSQTLPDFTQGLNEK